MPGLLQGDPGFGGLWVEQPGELDATRVEHVRECGQHFVVVVGYVTDGVDDFEEGAVESGLIRG
jgi:hypothetical protein